MKTPPFSSYLSGPTAFYCQPDYATTTRRALDEERPPVEIAYRYPQQRRSLDSVKRVAAIFAFPYFGLHSLVGKLVLLPASSPKILGLPDNFAHLIRKKVPVEDSDWKVKRLAVLVDGCRIDAAVVGRASTLGNGRWTVVSNGNGQFYEEKLGFDVGFRKVLEGLECNALVYNYPGVGSSEGWPNAWAMVRVQRAMQAFVSDREKGIGAKTVLLWGHSIGGGVQGEALRAEEDGRPSQGGTLVAIKSRSFDSLGNAASAIVGWVAGCLVSVLGWNFSPWRSSQRLRCPEIVLQTANVRQYADLKETGVEVVHDGIIPATASLAERILREGCDSCAPKWLIGMPEGHNDGERDPEGLVAIIESVLQASGK